MGVTSAVRYFQPSSGTQGEAFISSWCGNCQRDKAMREGLPSDECDDEELCPIIARTFAYPVDDPRYPSEWCYDEQGKPQCTAFVPVGQELPRPRCEFTLELPL